MNFSDPRRRRIRFRAWHRGLRELDIIMGRFADSALATLGEQDLDAFEQLLEAPDRDVLAWMTGTAELPRNYDTPVFRQLKAFHNHAEPIHS